MKLGVKLVLYAFGIVSLLAWIALCSGAFWFLLNSTPQGISDNLIIELSLPFSIVLIAVPLIGVLLVGGLQLLGQILSLKAFLGELPNQVSTLNKLTQQMDDKRKVFETLSSTISDTAVRIDETSSQLADFQAYVDSTQRHKGSGLAADPDELNLVDRLSDHLTEAKRLFDVASQDYIEMNGEDVERVRGWLLESSVRELQDHSCMTDMVADYVKAAIDIDRRTRRSGRRNLEDRDVQHLDYLKRRIETSD